MTIQISWQDAWRTTDGLCKCSSPYRTVTNSIVWCDGCKEHFDIGGIPIDKDIEPKEIFETELFRKAKKHLSIEIGGRKANSEAHRLVRKLKRIDRITEREGFWLQISSSNQNTAPHPWSKYYGFGVEVRVIKDNQIHGDFQLFSQGDGYLWRPVGSLSYHTSSRADVLLRKVLRVSQ